MRYVRFEFHPVPLCSNAIHLRRPKFVSENKFVFTSALPLINLILRSYQVDAGTVGNKVDVSAMI
jgi:hypothetical protein